jgi:hypothetical protein
LGSLYKCWINIFNKEQTSFVIHQIQIAWDRESFVKNSNLGPQMIYGCKSVYLLGVSLTSSPKVSSVKLLLLRVMT